MKRRLVAAVVAIVLAVVGGVMVLSYVSGADRRAQAGMKTMNVLVATAAIPEGTPADQLGDLVTVKSMPAMAVAAGTVTDLSQIKGLVANADLQAGEQLLAGRFAAASAADPDAVQIPKGLQQVSVLLESQRVVGGNINAGAKVGVFITVDKQTHLTLHQVLVSRVQGGTAPATPAPDDQAATPAPLPEGSVMVTLAVDAAAAEKVVFAAENGTIWLSLADATAVANGTSVVTAESVYK